MCCKGKFSVRCLEVAFIRLLKEHALRVQGYTKSRHEVTLKRWYFFIVSLEAVFRLLSARYRLKERTGLKKNKKRFADRRIVPSLVR